MQRTIPALTLTSLISPVTERMTAVMYVQADGTALYAVSPKPPTPEAVARAQFVDKTYVWKGAAPKAQLP
jgi:hypothetical protein